MIEKSISTIKKTVIHLLFCMFQEQETYSIVSYESVDDFYASLGDTFESENLLHLLDVNGTSDLQEMLIDYNANLDGDMTDEAFGEKWCTV